MSEQRGRQPIEVGALLQKVLDDDPGIHAVWARRLSELRLRPSLCHLRDERELREYVASRPTDSSDLFLVDYELGVGQPNGGNGRVRP